jgi:hypothetical protein
MGSSVFMVILCSDSVMATVLVLGTVAKGWVCVVVVVAILCDAENIVGNAVSIPCSAIWSLRENVVVDCFFYYI